MQFLGRSRGWGLPAGGTGEIFEPFKCAIPLDRARLRLQRLSERVSQARRCHHEGETPQRHASNRRKLLLLGCCGADGAIEVLHCREPGPTRHAKTIRGSNALALHGSVSRA